MSFWRALQPLAAVLALAVAAPPLRHRITSTAGVLLLPSPHPTVSRLVGVWQFASTFQSSLPILKFHLGEHRNIIFLSNNESVCLPEDIPWRYLKLYPNLPPLIPPCFDFYPFFLVWLLTSYLFVSSPTFFATTQKLNLTAVGQFLALLCACTSADTWEIQDPRWAKVQVRKRASNIHLIKTTFNFINDAKWNNGSKCEFFSAFLDSLLQTSALKLFDLITEKTANKSDKRKKDQVSHSFEVF